MPSNPSIRPVEPADVHRLPLIEAAADRLLADRFGPELFSGVTPGETRVATPGFVLVAQRPCVGFAQVVESGGAAHLQQLAVDPSHGRRGVGAALVQACCEEALHRGHGELTLTTFRDVPFNAPWYARLGFTVVAEPTAALSEHLEDERTLAQVSPRLAMRRTLGEPPEWIQ